MTCNWCGDTHRSDQLCQRAERGMTRRSFCFLFWAGCAALALRPTLPPVASYKFTGITALAETMPTLVQTRNVTGHRIYSSNGNGAYSLLAELPPIKGPLTMVHGAELKFSDGEGRSVTPTWLAPAYRRRS